MFRRHLRFRLGQRFLFGWRSRYQAGFAVRDLHDQQISEVPSEFTRGISTVAVGAVMFLAVGAQMRRARQNGGSHG